MAAKTKAKTSKVAEAMLTDAKETVMKQETQAIESVVEETEVKEIVDEETTIEAEVKPVEKDIENEKIDVPIEETEVKEIVDEETNTEVEVPIEDKKMTSLGYDYVHIWNGICSD